MAESNEFKCPRCGLSLPGGSTFCPECGKDFREELLGFKQPEVPKKDYARMNLLTAIIAPAAVAFGVVSFQVGYTSIFLAFIVPAVAFALVYVWERNRGLKPGWEFFALAAVGTYAGATFGFVWVLVPVFIYFLVMRYRLNKKEEMRKARIRNTNY
jgi:hypothetical protein